MCENVSKYTEFVVFGGKILRNIWYFGIKIILTVNVWWLFTTFYNNAINSFLLFLVL
jgi:hypothetical protein